MCENIVTLAATTIITNPKDQEVDSMNDSYALCNAAFVNHRGNRLTEAEALYRRVLETDPRQSNALGMLGMLLMNGPDTAEAESVFLRHLEADADNPEQSGTIAAMQG